MSATDILRICDEVLAARKLANKKLPLNPMHQPYRYHDAHYIAIAANTAPTLAEYIRRLHEAAAVAGVDLDRLAPR